MVDSSVTSPLQRQAHTRQAAAEAMQVAETVEAGRYPPHQPIGADNTGKMGTIGYPRGPEQNAWSARTSPAWTTMRPAQIVTCTVSPISRQGTE